MRPVGISVHAHALCETEMVGEGTRIWAFAHLLPGAQIGQRCNICDHVFIENDVVIGNDVTIKCGVQLWDGIRLGNDVFVGPNATFTNDRFPRSKRYPDRFLQTIIEDGASIGANATILPGIRVATGAMVGAGAVVTRDVPPHATVVGNPAVIVGYRNGARLQAGRTSTAATSELPGEIGTRRELQVRGCWIERLPHYTDMRGSLTPLETGKGLPFEPQRVFLVHGVPSNHVRGEHAHHRCEQLLVAAHGALSVVVDDGVVREEVLLDDPSIGLYLAPMIWGVQYKFGKDTVLMVAASAAYDASDYIRDYSEFRRLATGRT